MGKLSERFKIYMGLGGASLILALLTLVWHDWIEIVFRIDPDGGSGALEWLIVVVLAAAGLVFAVLAQIEWRRLRLRST